MFDIAPQLQAALNQAQTQMAAKALQTARGQTQRASGGTDATMAAFASRAIFSEALLSALHARLAEIKAVAK